MLIPLSPAAQTKTSHTRGNYTLDWITSRVHNPKNVQLQYMVSEFLRAVSMTICMRSFLEREETCKITEAALIQNDIMTKFRCLLGHTGCTLLGYELLIILKTGIKKPQRITELTLLHRRHIRADYNAKYPPPGVQSTGRTGSLKVSILQELKKKGASCTCSTNVAK